MNLLNKFYTDFQIKGAVKEFLLDHLKAEAISRSFKGESTAGIMEAKMCIDKAFRDLDKQFEIKPQKKRNSNK